MRRDWPSSTKRASSTDSPAHYWVTIKGKTKRQGNGGEGGVEGEGGGGEKEEKEGGSKRKEKSDQDR